MGFSECNLGAFHRWQFGPIIPIHYLVACDKCTQLKAIPVTCGRSQWLLSQLFFSQISSFVVGRQSFYRNKHRRLVGIARDEWCPCSLETAGKPYMLLRILCCIIGSLFERKIRSLHCHITHCSCVQLWCYDVPHKQTAEQIKCRHL